MKRPSFLPFLFRNRQVDQTPEFENFIRQYPEYETTKSLDELRIKDFARLDEQRHTYLDFTGGQLYGVSQLKSHHDFLANAVLGNPHSINPSSALAENHIKETRKRVLDYFNAGDNYICIFTANASAAIKIVGESYPFTEKDQLVLTVDNHNSVNGIREYARSKNCNFQYSPILSNLRVDEAQLIDSLRELKGENKLFAFPAQSNVSGVKHDLSLITEAQSRGWDVLLDAAAFAPSDILDLSIHQPEFIALSFYKIFGYPTGLGALLVKKDTFSKLKKPSFAGGTITIVSIKGDGYHLEQDAARFEDGTVNYLDIPAIKSGLDYVEAIGIQTIKTRVDCLTRYLLSKLQDIKHSNGRSLVEVYGPQTGLNRGGTLAMNFFDPSGKMYDFITIEQKAYEENISIRTGCFCNPGIDETNHTLNKERLKSYFTKRGKKDYFDLIEFLGQKRGAVRVSIGYITNFQDIERFLSFCNKFLNKKFEE